MKTKTDMDARILAIAEPVADDMGYDIVRVRVMANKRTTVQIMAERKSDGTMKVEDCAKLSRELSSVLEVEDPLRDPYALEVSSPGIDRPLTTLSQFARHEGYLVKLELDRLVEGRKRFRGTLAGNDGEMVGIDLDGEDETAFIPFDWMAEAKLVITDEMIDAVQKQRALEKSEDPQNLNQQNFEV